MVEKLGHVNMDTDKKIRAVLSRFMDTMKRSNLRIVGIGK